MSSYTRLCHENGCVCAKCCYRHNYKNGPKDCHGGGCTDCIPELKMGEEDYEKGLYGPTLECPCGGPYDK